MNEKRLYVDLHVVQTVPPSCINRDDTGSPKTAVYGGTTRARVSSQPQITLHAALMSEIIQRSINLFQPINPAQVRFLLCC